MKAHIIVERRVTKKPKAVKYDISHIVESKDMFGNSIFVKQNVGTTQIRNLEAEIKEYELQIDYRKRVIEEINHLEKNKLQHSNYAARLEEFIAERDAELKK